MTVLTGEKVFIYGPSGSGKTTLLNLIAGILISQSGSLVILDKNIMALPSGARDSFRGDHIGFVFQSFNLIPYLTIYENILLPLKSSTKRLANAGDNVDGEIKRLADHLEMEKFLNKRVSQLSIGQQQRVAVARSLIGNPQIIIADEPTSSLDEDIANRFMQLLLAEHEKKQFTLLFVSHDKRLARFFDREIALAEINKGLS